MAINSKSPAGSSPLVLKELDVPGRTSPVSQAPDVWGLNIAAVQDNFPRQGLLCRAGPWGVMSRGDKLVISLGGQPVFNKTVDDNDVNTTLSMFVPAARFTDGASTLAYAVTRQGGTAEPSEVMQVRVKLTRPGGHDSDEGPGHSKLKMTIPREILEGGIDKDNIAAGVPIRIGPSDDGPQPYPNAAAGDEIQVTWGGVFVLYGPLTQDEADGKVPVIVKVTEQDIRCAEDSGEAGLAVAYEVYDIVENRAEDWSYEQRVVVAVDADRLGAPICKETLNNVLDADKLGDADGTAQILAVDGSKFKVGDIPIVRLKGTPVEGAPINIEVTGTPLVSVPSIPEIKISNAALRQLAKTQIGLSFRLKKADGSADLLSKTQFINVIGEIQRLQAPVALDAAQGALNPELVQARIEIPFDKSFAAGQAIKLFWLGTRPDLSTYLPDLPLRPITQGDITTGAPLLINVPGLHLKQIEGGKLELYYQLLIEDAVLGTMNRVNATHAIRESIHAESLNVGEPRKELPEPKVDGVVDGVLPADMAGTTLTVEYLNTVKDDEVTYFWNGSKTGPDSDSVKLSSFTAGQPVPFTIKAELIKGNEGGTVEASYSIKWADGRPTSYSDVKPFSVGVALDLTAPKVKEAPNDTSLIPNAAKDALTAIVDYVGMLLGDKIIVTFTGAAGTPAGGSHTAPEKTVTVLGAQEIPLANSVVAFNLNKAVTVSYTVKRGSGAPLPSDTRPLAVQSLVLDLSNVPKILQAANNGDGQELDLDAIKSSATLRALGWPLIALRQYVWLKFRGTLSDDSPYEKALWAQPGPVTNSGWVTNGYYDSGLSTTFLNEFKNLKHDSSFSIEFKAALGSSTIEADAVSFPVRTYMVKAIADVKPVITRAEDSKGVEILPGEFTVDTNVTLIGTSAPGQKVQIFDGPTPDGQPTAELVTGIWRHTLTGRTLAPHTFTAQALYGSGQTSDPRTLTVVEAIALSLTSLRDNNGEIGENGETTSTIITLQGRFTSGHQVQIYDNDAGKHTVTAVGQVWDATLSVDLGSHSINARAVSTGEFSNRRSFRVISPIPPLRFNTNPVTLNGTTYLVPSHPHVLPVFDSGTSVHHPATEGVPGYTYSSSNPAVVVVDQSGLVTVRGRGTATITARDAVNQSKSYTVSVTGAIHKCLHVGVGNWGVMKAKAESMGTRLPTIVELRGIYAAYGNRWPIISVHRFWSSTTVGNKYQALVLATGVEETVPDNYGGDTVGLQ
ncbi:Ig-like domain-containing protein [Pseudomonas sp. HS6]|uniref:Ig-like domain-containing protein n=1 Tax=Pseudomonas sp. HS6 TaxID=2850559 RepID=UPI002018F7AF|nr:Ig-like domain-containing protein [Pseudomonas sp. HS6]UQS15189.1 Ig-like domain-containing protein [Pseudomonas sp. HS6]